MSAKKEKAPARGKPTPKQLTNYKAICSQMSSSQTQKILKYLLQYGRISTMDAFRKFNCTRLSARIFDLKELGIGIESTMVFKKKNGENIHYAEYRLI